MTIWKGGSPLGFWKDKPHGWDGNEPTLIFGPPGSFKSVGVVANQMLDDDGKRSFLVLDTKAEVAGITANYRRRVCGAENVKVISPYHVLKDKRPDLKSDGWNALDDLDPNSPEFGDDCAAKGDALIKTDSNEHQKHFPDSARSGITGTIMFEVMNARAHKLPPLLANVRAILTQEPKALKESVQRMMACKDFDITSRLAKFLADTDEIGGIKSTIETQTAWMTKPMRDDMAVSNGVDFRELKKRPMTVYVILPTKELQSKAVWLRLILSSALRALYHDGGVPCTLLVEEGFVLGHHAEIENAAAILRGYGSRMTIVFQSLQQIKKLYGENWGTFTGGAVLGFRPGDLETAKWMTEKAGTEYVTVLSAADPSNPNEIGARPSWRTEKREKIPVGKMFGMPQGPGKTRALVWLPGHEDAFNVRVKGYFEIPELNARADPNPYYKG